MTDTLKLLALFDEINPAADALDRLRELGISDDQMHVITGAPVTAPMLGRAHAHSNVPRYALGGAILGVFIGLFFARVTPDLYTIYVGGQPLQAVPPSVVVIFEMLMLGMLISTFIGVFLESTYPSFTKKEYVPEISDGKIAVVFDCPTESQVKFEEAMSQAGAATVRLAESVQP